jgi:2-polyprenyl-3-methyl-5-hydroxy-6-metoxy-1,4-benzoquinol methylase
VASAQHRAGALADSERYRHILSLFADDAETHGVSAVEQSAQGRIGERVSRFALELDESEWRKMVLVFCAKSVASSAENNRLRGLVLRALNEGWVRPRYLTRVCVSLLTLRGVIKEAIACAERAWPQRLSATDLFGATGLVELAHDELLCRLLETERIPDLGLERLLANIRRVTLMSAYAALCGTPACSPSLSGARDDLGLVGASPVGSETEDPLLAFCCSIARQCFVNDYVFSITEEEREQMYKLRAALETALTAEQPVPALWPVVIGAYVPLHSLKNKQVLLARAWPASVAALLVQQVKEPAQEHRIAAELPALTAIEGEVSRLVRQQYEENPYPRWITAGPGGRPAVLDNRGLEQKLGVLIAGCGTGLSATELARGARSARILAIDLSRASLSYAKRMAQKFALTNVEFAQADIMKLGSLGQQFDFINASGVLHHLADPWEGWRILLSLLRPGGAMEVGLYSAQARRNVVAGRALIAQRGYQPTPDDIRRCREEIAAAEDGSLLKSLTQLNDFFTISECRDLLFHPQEHRLTLPDIEAFLAANDLQFTGFALPPSTLHRFALRFPGDVAMTDLKCWHAFECEAPETFGGMYHFTVLKPQTAQPVEREAAAFFQKNA